jgi:hypothetical protein
MAKRSKKALSKTVKFLSSLITSPCVTLLNKKFPRIENIKKISISSEMTFINDGRENVIVYRIACNPSALPANLNILVTLNTLITLASYGPTDKKPLSPNISSRKPKAMSNTEATTTKKSNLFHALLK